MYEDLAIQDCIEACMQAQLEAEQCAATALGSEDVSDLRHCISLCRDVSEVCALTIHFLAHNSDMAAKACELCVDVCVTCRDECGRHELEYCQKCAEACHVAADRCERLALQPL